MGNVSSRKDYQWIFLSHTFQCLEKYLFLLNNPENIILEHNEEITDFYLIREVSMKLVLGKEFQETMPGFSAPRTRLQSTQMFTICTVLLTCCVKKRSSSGTEGCSCFQDTLCPARNPRLCSPWRRGM